MSLASRCPSNHTTSTEVFGANINEKRDKTNTTILFLIMFLWPWFYKDPGHEGYCCALHRVSSSVFGWKTTSLPFICRDSLVLGDKDKEIQWKALLTQAGSQYTHQFHNVAQRLSQHQYKWIDIFILPTRKVLEAAKENRVLSESKTFDKPEHKCLFKRILKLWFRLGDSGQLLNPMRASTCRGLCLESPFLMVCLQNFVSSSRTKKTPKIYQF